MDSKTIKLVARAGLSAKGIVYSLLGLLALMAAFQLNGKSAKDAGTKGVFSFIEDQTGGNIILLVIAAGLACYVIWRMIQAFQSTHDKPKMAKRARYFLSGLSYSALAVQVVRMALTNREGSGRTNKKVASELLSADSGQWLVGLLATIILAIGIYQIYYGLSEKYRKHVDSTGASGKESLLLAGKIGYVARGIVWLLVSYLFYRAAMEANSKKAGSTADAFGFLQQSDYGTILMALMAAGLICYGVFCFVRAKYEEFN